MARRSKFEQLPKSLKDELANLWRSKRYSVDDLLARMRELGGDVSRSGLHRGVKDYAKTMERYRRVQEHAAFVLERVQAGDPDLSRLLSEMIKTQAFELLIDMSEVEIAALDKEAETSSKTGKPGAMEMMLIAKMLQHITSADKNNLEFRKKVEDDARAKAADAFEKTATAEGLSKDTIQKFRANILGVEAK